MITVKEKERDIVNIVDKITQSQIRKDIPEIRTGYNVRVGVEIKEGNKTRIQNFDGLVVAVQGGGVSKNIIVRKKSGGVQVERTFPVHSPRIEKVEVVRHGKVRRAKLHYLRGLTGKKAKIRPVIQ